MTTIDQFGMDIHVGYARRTESLESIRREFPGIDRTESIPAQLQVVDFRPRPAEVDLLLGVARVLTPWAVFLPPRQFTKRRRSPFTVARVVPTLGSQEDQDALESQILNTVCDSPEQEREKHMLLACFQQITKINDWLGHIVSRIGQFLQA